LSFWERELHRRRSFLQDLIIRLEGENQARKMSRSRLARLEAAHPIEVLEAVRRASEGAERITARLLQSWIIAWQQDEERWRKSWRSVPKSRPQSADMWSQDFIRACLKQPLTDVELESRAQLIWPDRPPANASISRAGNSSAVEAIERGRAGKGRVPTSRKRQSSEPTPARVLERS
jgi:hypothetical protein